jgi:hypothetical protein
MTFSTTPVVCLTLAKWETVFGQFGGYLILPLIDLLSIHALGEPRVRMSQSRSV